MLSLPVNGGIHRARICPYKHTATTVPPSETHSFTHMVFPSPRTYRVMAIGARSPIRAVAAEEVAANDGGSWIILVIHELSGYVRAEGVAQGTCTSWRTWIKTGPQTTHPQRILSYNIPSCWPQVGTPSAACQGQHSPIVRSTCCGRGPLAGRPPSSAMVIATAVRGTKRFALAISPAHTPHITCTVYALHVPYHPYLLSYHFAPEAPCLFSNALFLSLHGFRTRKNSLTKKCNNEWDVP